MQTFKSLVGIARKSLFSSKLLDCHLSWNKVQMCNLQKVITRENCNIADNDEPEFEVENYMYDQISNEYLGIIAGGHKVLIIQPYIKWGRSKIKITTPELQMQEAEALVNTLPYWTVENKIYAPLMSFKKKCILGHGSLMKLKEYLAENSSISAIFFSLNTMKYYQTKALRNELGVEIFDRYSLIIHIFRAHAKTPEAKLQVALAELPFIRRKVKSLSENDCGMINLMEHRKLILEARETKLKKKLDKLREHRMMIRKTRVHREIPTIAVVGYTNAGKTSLIKALTGDINLKPRNQLFATLDTTVHEGILPCKMKVLFVDTIGFIQNVPEMLIEPFKTTLNDALIANILIHVYDASHPDKVAQIQHVENTIKSLFVGEESPVIINVANKCDLMKEGTVPEDHLSVVATSLKGIDLLRHQIQEKILTASQYKIMTMKVKSGSPAEAWLYRQMTVLHAEADEDNGQNSKLQVITTENQFYKFIKYLKESTA